MCVCHMPVCVVLPGVHTASIIWPSLMSPSSRRQDACEPCGRHLRTFSGAVEQDAGRRGLLACSFLSQSILVSLTHSVCPRWETISSCRPSRCCDTPHLSIFSFRWLFHYQTRRQEDGARPVSSRLSGNSSTRLLCYAAPPVSPPPPDVL